MQVTRFADARRYDAPKHFDMRSLRLQGFDVSDSKFAWVRLSHFLPAGGAEARAIRNAGNEVGNHVGGHAASWTASMTLPTIDPSALFDVRGKSAIVVGATGAFGKVACSDDDVWFSKSDAGKIGRISPAGVITEYSDGISKDSPEGALQGEYEIPSAAAGARAICSGDDGRLFFSEYDRGAIGEIRPAGWRNAA